jgi:hypothetical protein
MRKLAAAFVLTALVAPISAQQRATIRWEPTGGPLVAQQKQIIVQRGRLLLVGTGGQWWRSPDRGKSWKAFEEGTPRPWILAADERTLFGDAIDGVLRSIDMGDSWTRCGVVPVNRRTGNEVTSIAADEGRVYVSIFRVGLFRSDDQCATWMQLETPWKLEFPPSITYANGSRVIVRALGGSFLSVDAGKTWTRLEGTLPDSLALTTGCNGVIVAGTGRGVFASRDDGRSWAPLGLEGRWVPAVAAPGCDEVFAVVQDSGLWTHSVFRSTDGGANWATVNEGLSGHPIIGLTTGDGKTYAAGSSGAFQWSSDKWQQIGPADTTVTSVVVAPWGEAFAAGGWMGLFASRTTGRALAEAVNRSRRACESALPAWRRRLCSLLHAQGRHSCGNTRRRRPAITRSRSDMAIRGSESYRPFLCINAQRRSFGRHGKRHFSLRRRRRELD